jgi:predicted nucleotidyltransferase
MNSKTHLSPADQELLARCRSAVSEIDPKAEMILYGSRARGDAETESDYDLLIITDGDASLKREDRFRAQLFPIEVETGAVLTVFLLNRQDWKSPLYRSMPFIQNVLNDGVPI